MALFPTPPDEHETLEMVRRLQGGDEDAWTQLYGRYRDDLLFTVRAGMGAKLRASLQSEDVLQSAALEAFRALPKYEDRGPGSLRGFLNRLVLNKLRDRGRALATQKRAGAVPLTPSLAAGIPAPDYREGVYEDARFGRLENALKQLPEDMQQVIVARKIQSLSSQEVARLMGRSDDAARKLYSRAMARLSSLIAESPS